MGSTREQLDKALGSHSLWKHRLRDLVESGIGDLDPATAIRDDACDLGRWLKRFKPGHHEVEIFHSVCHLHTEFHKSVGKIALLVSIGQTAEAKKEMGMNSAYARSSSSLNSVLQAWKNQL